MLSSWSKLLNTDCQVIKIKSLYIYPIFKNGSTQLLAQKDKLIVNDDIKSLKNIIIILRDPTERFIAGVNKVAFVKKTTVAKTMTKIKNNKLIDRHFVPQFIWLLHLKKYYDGDVELTPMYTLDRLLTNKTRDESWPKNTITINPIKKFINIDEKMIQKYMHKNIKLKTIIKDLINVLPKN